MEYKLKTSNDKTANDFLVEHILPCFGDTFKDGEANLSLSIPEWEEIIQKGIDEGLYEIAE